MHHNFDDPKKWTSKIDNDELGAWIRLCRVASKAEKRGILAIEDGIPYTAEQINQLIKTDKGYLKKWLKQGAVKQENGCYKIEKWKEWQNEQDRKNQSEQPKQTTQTDNQIDTPNGKTDLDLDLDLDLDKDKEKIKDLLSAKADPRIKVLIDYFFNKHLELLEKKVHIDGGKDGKTMQTLLKTFNEQELKDRIDWFITFKDDFVDNAGRTIGVFKSQINKYKDTKTEAWRDL